MASTYQYIVDTGVVNVSTDDMLSEVEAEWIAALGAKLNTAAATLQGTMIAAEVISRVTVMKNNAEMANVFNPQYSYGVFLDAICALLGIGRGKNVSTFVTLVTLNGDPSTSIPAGSRVQTINGDIFSTVSTVTVGANRTVTVTLQSQSYGDIPGPVGELQILDGKIGWGSAYITENSVVVRGTTQLTDGQLKISRNKRLATQGRNSTEAVMAAINSVANVKSAKVVVNNTGAAGVVNGVTFTLGRAIWVCIHGTPLDADVGAALWSAHGGSTPYEYGSNSGTPVNSPNGTRVYDKASGLPYVVKWTKAVEYDAYVEIIVSQGTSAQSPQETVANSMVSYANGEMAGDDGFVVGKSVSAFELSGAVQVDSPGLYIKSCKVACVPKGSAAPAASDYVYEYPLDAFSVAELTVGRVQVTVV